MSNYIRKTKHPYTGQWEYAEWLDDYYGQHNYGVRFPSDKKVYMESVYRKEFSEEAPSEKGN